MYLFHLHLKLAKKNKDRTNKASLQLTSQTCCKMLNLFHQYGFSFSLWASPPTLTSHPRISGWLVHNGVVLSKKFVKPEWLCWCAGRTSLLSLGIVMSRLSCIPLPGRWHWVTCWGIGSIMNVRRNCVRMCVCVVSLSGCPLVPTYSIYMTVCVWVFACSLYVI